VFRYVPPGPPELGKCAKVAAGAGAYSDAGCTKKAKKGGSYSWSALSEAAFLESEGAPLVLETTGKTKLECSFGKIYTGLYDDFAHPPGLDKGVFGVLLFMTGCSSSGVQCTSAGREAGQIQSQWLEGFFGVEKAGKRPTIALDLFPEAGRSAVFAEYKCGSISRSVRGSVIASVPVVNQMASSYTLRYTATKGKQRPGKLVGGPVDVLETSTNGGPYEKTAITATLLVLYEGIPFEINSTLGA
jgi:hypothetical protein